MDYHNDQYMLFRDPAELSGQEKAAVDHEDRRHEVAIDQGVENYFMATGGYVEQADAVARTFDSDIATHGVAVAANVLRPRRRRSARRSFMYAERGLGREDSRRLAEAEAAESPFMTNEERAVNLEHLEEVRLINRAATAEEAYKKLEDECRDEYGRIDQHRLNAILRKRNEAEAARVALHDANVSRLHAK